jgi:hypothetical protein
MFHAAGVYAKAIRVEIHQARALGKRGCMFAHWQKNPLRQQHECIQSDAEREKLSDSEQCTQRALQFPALM